MSMSDLTQRGSASMIRRIKPEQAQLGMYIHSLGGSWLSHPFWRTKFVLASQSDVNGIHASSIPYLEIDDELGIGLSEDSLASNLPHDPPPHHSRNFSQRPSRFAPSRLIAPRARLPSKGAASPERQRALMTVSRSKRVMRGMFESVRLGRAVKVADVLPLVDEIAQSVESGELSLLEVVQLKNSDEYTYLHSVAVSALMANFARHSGKSPADMREYGLAGLLHDIGKIKIDQAILHKQGKLTDDEFILVKEHAEQGYQLLREVTEIPDLALDVVRHHHEKVDGTGYPFGLSGDGLSEGARIGAICDVYDALTSNRAYKQAWTPSKALSAMWGWQGHFDRDMLFSFMQSLSIFPVGMLVHMRSGRLGVVLDPAEGQTQARVRCFYDTAAGAMIEPEEVPLAGGDCEDDVMAPADPTDWELGNPSQTIASAA
jgi:putative nucleotidyltransferase with HDIG domain